jgi:hypothetical protein
MAEQQHPLQQLQLLHQQQSNLHRDVLRLLQEKERGIYTDIQEAAQLRTMVESLVPEAARWRALAPPVPAPPAADPVPDDPGAAVH